MLLEYRILLSAYEARQKNRNRQAIIDASAAAEICLVRNIKKHFSVSGLNGEFFLKKYKGLGERFGLMHQLDGAFLDSDYQNKIVHPRNEVVHIKTQSLSDETTDTLILAVEDCLKWLTSLSHMPFSVLAGHTRRCDTLRENEKGSSTINSQITSRSGRCSRHGRLRAVKPAAR